MKYDPELLHGAAYFNPQVFENASSLLNDFPWGTEVCKTLFKDSTNLHDLNDLTIASILSSVMIADEIRGFLDLINSMKLISNKKEIDILVENIFKYYKVRKVHSIVNNHSDDVSQLIKKIKDIPDNLATGVKINNLGAMNPSQVIEEDLGGMNRVIPTNFKVVKEATPFDGYIPGQVVQWVGAPGKGKSAGMLFEVALMAVHNFKILWLAMGDLMRYDFITRFTAVVTGQKYYQVALNPDKYFDDDVKEVASNIDLITIPAGRLTSEELVNIVETSNIPYDVIVVDYDSNFKTDNDNMYTAGGDIYNDLTAIARPEGKQARLVFIASQPKIHHWEDLKIPESGAGESARKQHIIDIMITLGTAGIDRPAGIMYLPKVRRGKAGGETGYYMDDSGRFIEITKEELSLMRRY